MLTINDLTPWSLWRHRKTNSFYVVLGVALCSTNGPGEHKEQSVVYMSLTHQHLCYRELSEFLDGRFVREEPGHA
jgi:hypothetical protein